MENNNMENTIISEEKKQLINTWRKNSEILETALGNIQFNKKFFIGCSICSLCATTLGVVGMIVTGAALPTIATTVLGFGSGTFDLFLIDRENKEEEKVNESIQKNGKLLQKYFSSSKK